MDVALVGVVGPEFENHSLGALRAALNDAGFTSCVVPFAGFAGIEQMVRDVLRIQPRICGVSLQTTESTLAALVFTRLLRDRGFTGMLVLGGHVATLCAEAILSAPAGVDVVIELAGEVALVGLANGLDPLTLPGTRTRRGRGGSPIAVKPQGVRRARLSEHLGFGAADVILSRGCAASCGYCCVAAVSDLAESTGTSRHVVREIAAIADEIAGLAARDARAFHFMDDNVLPLDSAEALGWVRSLREALAARSVPAIAFSLQLRADVVTAALADELVELGLVRAYIGIDGYSAGQLRAIGRSAPASAGNAAISELTRRGVYCVANALLVGPTIRFETVVSEIDALATISGAPVHLLPIEARPGTTYHRRATARGLIEGGPLWPVYRFEDARTFLIAEVVTGLPTRLAERSVPIALYDLAWGLGVAQRLAPQAQVGDAIETYRRVTTAWNADQIRVMRLAAAAAHHGKAAIEELLAREQAFVRAHDDALLRACDGALADVEHAVSSVRPRKVRAQARGRMLGGLALAMGLASACGHEAQRPPDATLADATVLVEPDVAPPAACVDPSRTSQWSPRERPTCDCGNTQVKITFDANGEITSIAGDTAPLASDVERCLLDLFASYCYPSLAGMTHSFMTCHAWIA